MKLLIFANKKHQKIKYKKLQKIQKIQKIKYK